MAPKNLKRSIQALVMLTLFQAPLFPSVAFAKKSDKACSAVSRCEKLGTAGMNALGSGLSNTASGDTGTSGDAGGVAGAAGACSSNLAAAASQCEGMKKDCSTCGPEQKVKECQEGIDAAIARFNSQSASCGGTAAGAGQTQSASQSGGGGGGGGGDMMMGMMMGAAMGMLASKMMEKDEEKKPQGPVASMCALQQNGTVDCSKPDAYHYRGCNPQFEGRCGANLDDPTCQQFSARYCGANSGLAQPPPPCPPPPPLPNTIVPDASTFIGTAGEGSTTQYCKNVLAWNYCKTSGRDMCPSCLQMAKLKSPACIQNPALCLAQNSPAEVEKAKQTCPTDPAFSDPSYANGGTTTPPTGTPSTGNLPAVVLPQSAGSSRNVANTSGVSTSGAASAGSFAVASVHGSSGAPGDQGLREGQGSGGSSATYSNGSAGGGVATTYNGAPGHNEMANGGGSGNRGPASDIEGRYGSNLFRTSSAVYRSRCQQGRLNNCP